MTDQMLRRRPRQILTVVASALAALALVAGCSSEDDSAAPSVTTPTVESTATPDPVALGNECDREPAAPPQVVAVDGSTTDLTMTSFDGTQIRLHWFPTAGAEPAPVVLMGPGWSLSGDTSMEKSPMFGAVGIGELNDAGYNVLTWDPRGFGQSTGTVTANSPDHEGRDVQLALDWLASLPEVELDDDGDPRVGMAGFSYGGGIQLTLASVDCRVDAIVPGIAWSSLETSLHRSDTFKAGWGNQLADLGAAAGRLDPHITEAQARGNDTGTITGDDAAWFAARGPGESVARITAPTLIVQGTVDTLFTLDEAIANYQRLTAAGTPTVMLWFCGGHGTCLTEEGDTSQVGTATLAWLDRWLKDSAVDTGPGFTMVDQHGERWVADRYPTTGVDSDDLVLAAGGSGTLDLTDGAGSGPIAAPGVGVLDRLVAPFTPTRAERAVDVAIVATDDAVAIGAPELTLNYRGTAPAGERPTRAFAQIVDDESGHVVGNQITPIPLVLDGSEHSITVPLEVVAHRVAPGSTLTLQIVASTTAYAPPRFGGSVTFDDIQIRIPLAGDELRPT